MNDINNFDVSVVYRRKDGSFVVNNGMYHVPNEGEWADLYSQICDYVNNNPEVVREEEEIEEQPSQDTIIENYKRYVQNALDTFARTRGYDDIHTAASYKDSLDPQFKLEGEYCYNLRTDTWRQCWNILDDVLNGKMEQPTEEELIEILPVGSAKWPDEN